MRGPAGGRPAIGISCAHFTTREGVVRVGMTRDYVRAVARAGGVPVLLPILPPEAAAELLGLVRGLVLAGGGDIDPHAFGEEPAPGLGPVDPERDACELALARMALAQDVPVLGICRGAQLLNVAAGGSLYQDIPGQVPGALQHSQQAPRWHGSHAVAVEAASRLARILGVTRLRVNSFHHQAVKALGPGLAVSARADDGVVEAVESPQHRFVVGVQWHPEAMVEHDPLQRRLFEALVEAADHGSGAQAEGRPALGAVVV